MLFRYLLFRKRCQRDETKLTGCEIFRRWGQIHFLKFWIKTDIRFLFQDCDLGSVILSGFTIALIWILILAFIIWIVMLLVNISSKESKTQKPTATTKSRNHIYDQVARDVWNLNSIHVNFGQDENIFCKKFISHVSFYCHIRVWQAIHITVQVKCTLIMFSLNIPVGNLKVKPF